MVIEIGVIVEPWLPAFWLFSLDRYFSAGLKREIKSF